MAAPPVPVSELFWSLVDKADRKFTRIRDLPNYGRSRNDADFLKAFKIYTRLWKLQQENRQRLVDAGLKRWEIGEIASRIAQLYYGRYQRSSDTSFLAEAFIFYEAILTREYFLCKDGGLSASQEAALANKQLRFLARFLIVCLVLGRREMAARLVQMIRALVDECKQNFQDTEFKDWKHILQEISRFLKFDTPFMNMRPLRYSFVYDNNPQSLSVVSSDVKRGLVLREAILSSYYHNEVKVTELTLDTFRMLQCLEWEPCGVFALKISADSSNNGSGPNCINPLQDIKDRNLPPNPQKVVLYRPSVTYLLMVLATICEELPPDGIMLIYLSAAGEYGLNLPVSLSSGITQDPAENTVGGSDDVDSTSPLGSPTDSPTQFPSQNKENQSCLWLGSHGTKGSNYLYPYDLIPFTRKPLFLVIDSNNSHAFKTIHGNERGETTAMLLSPISRASPVGASTNSSRHQNGSLFTLFLTAPVQAFCFLLGISGTNIDKDAYNKAEKLFSLSLSEWENTLVTSNSLHPVWVEVLGDPLLRRLLLRFVFCRTVLGLYARTFHQGEFLPTCLPNLPQSVDPEDVTSQSAVLRLANYFGATKHFKFSEGIELPADEINEPFIKDSDIHESYFSTSKWFQAKVI